MAEKEAEFEARPYQVELYEKALLSNSIIYLPTGSGKTYIAVMLIKTMSKSIRRPYSEGGKRTIFAVNTVPLVHQQCEYIGRLTDLECQGYSGDQGVDFWSGDMWQQQFEKYQVLVMTSQIFLDILSHGYMSIDRVNLIIFDECHRAVGDHSMRRIMKFFEDCPDYKQPRILGTSATLLNSNVKLERVPDVVHDLEITFHAKIITVDSLEPIKGYGKPKEECVVYRQCRIMNPRINTMLEYMKQLLDKIELKEIGRNEETSKEFQPKGKTQKLKNIIEDAQEQLNMHDLYGGSIALLQHMLQFEKLKKSIDQAETLLIFMWLSTGMLSLRKMIADEMNQADLTDYEKFLKYSSDKVIKLLEILRMYYIAQSSKNEERKFCAIVFVRRRFTAKVLYSLLKVAAKLERRFGFIKPDYVVGSSINPYRNSCEDICITKWNKEALLRFRKGDSNCLIATDVLDEGVDIPICSLVIRYDLPNDFRAYVQSKGRARSSKSNYVMMIGSNDEAAEKTRHRHYQQTELVMRNYLIGKTDSRELPLPEEMQDSLYATEIKPYVVVDSDGVKYTISDVDAIQLVHRYCTSLSNSKFVHCVPTIKLIKHEDDDSLTQKIKYQVLIQMPITSPLREDIFGDKMPTINLAKRSAALKACIRLHQLGELNDKLLPRSIKEFVEDVNNLMANWREEDVEKKYLIGTYGNVRSHNLVYPQDFTDAFPEPGKKSYLHILKVVPTYQKPFESQRHREQVFYDILNDQAGFAILTNKKMSEIPGFPLFMSVGTLDVDLKINHSTVILTADEIEKLRNFHWVIFEKVLGVIKSFVARQADPHSENQFLIVPVDKEWTIDWTVVTSNQDLNEVAFSAGCSGNAPATTSLSIMSYNQPTTVSNHSYDDWELVRPNYRETCYVVTKVCYEMSPFSTFPTDDFIHYSHYYSVKHQKEITVRDQPLLEVKAISSNIDCTKPRGKSASAKRRDRDNFEEHLIPELCFKITFPRMYWLKATYLPSLLHRMSQLLIAEDLRKKIAEGAGLGVVGISSGTWESLKIPENNEASSKSIDDDALEEGEEDMDIIDELETDISPDNQSEIYMNPPDAEQVETTPEVDFLALESNVYNWSKEKEPMDLERNIENIQLIDIEYYHRFLNNRSLTAEIVTKKYERPVFAKRPNIPTPTLRVIDHQNNTKKALLSGPSPVNIMYALTTKISQDIFNLERLETLGDSYLKYIVSAYLFGRYPFYNEGRLTAYKGQIVGNRHLYYCGEAINLPGSLKNEYFEPKCNFIPPCFSVPKYIKNLVKIMNKMPNVLYEIDISRKERKEGQLSDETMDTARSTIASWTDNYGVIHTGTEPYLGQQIIKDKTVSDSVEALIGVYLQSMGIHAATKVIKFLGIIPSDTNIDDILVGKPASAAIGNGDPNFHMPWADAIENILGYQFKDRSFLLQAYTHPSYSNNNITGDYQRLEFLGDAIIDFLITVYIYENCGELSPGELTDLRSALVNNIIFACLTVKYGLHTGLLAFSPNLTDAIDKFVKFQEEKDFSVGDDLHWILLEEEECCMAEYVEVPKMLGDIFESIIGAIYLDTNKNLAKVWEILYCLMHEEIHKFSKNIPKDPVRLIHETQGARPEFKKAEVVEGTNTIMISLVVVLGGKKKLFYGFGATKKQAKRAASKQALKYFHSTLQG